MNEDRLEGTAQNIGGSIKSAVGDATGDTRLEAEGMVDQATGTAKRAYGRAKEKVASTGSAAADQLDDISALLGDTVAERPLTALLVAGAIGFVLAKLTSR